MEGEAGAAAWVERDDLAQWVIAAAGREGSVRFEAPEEARRLAGEAWVEVRALSHREALERETLGTWEEYELADSGQVICATRRFDLWAMAEYDYARSVVDFALPELQADGQVRLRRGREGDAEGNVAALAEMAPGLAQWVQECVDAVNLRDTAGRAALAEAKKNCASG